jgi:glycosyltransferase involved in cell wall biosynthesis
LIADNLGWDYSVITTCRGEVWSPLRESDFARKCSVVKEDNVADAARDADLVVSVKVLPESLGVARRATRLTGVPLLVDVDDPDVEADFLWGEQGLRTALGQVARERSRLLTRWTLRRFAQKAPTLVSNPVLQQIYGGAIIPHVRVDKGAGAPHRDREVLTIAFVGTVRLHKGIDLLREAVDNQDGRYRLVVTSEPPGDAYPWESWVGATSLDEGTEILKEADVVVLPSKPFGYAMAQLPMKLLDAMLAGRAIVVTDVGPLRWAVGDAGIVVEPTTSGIGDALSRLTDTELRRQLGTAARKMALARYTAEAIAPTFAAAVDAACAY